MHLTAWKQLPKHPTPKARAKWLTSKHRLHTAGCTKLESFPSLPHTPVCHYAWCCYGEFHWGRSSSVQVTEPLWGADTDKNSCMPLKMKFFPTRFLFLLLSSQFHDQPAIRGLVFYPRKPALVKWEMTGHWHSTASLSLPVAVAAGAQCIYTHFSPEKKPGDCTISFIWSLSFLTVVHLDLTPHSIVWSLTQHVKMKLSVSLY